MARQTAAEKELIRREKARKRAERRVRSAQAMAQGPDVYAKQIIASCLRVPFIHFCYSITYIIFDYIFGGHFIVKSWQKLLIKAGYVSEGALGVASVWALCNHTLHNFLVQNPLARGIIDPMNAFTMGVFTLIPDLILASAILMTINRYKVWVKREEKGVTWLWALLYTIPTIVFAGLTAYTLSTISSLAGGGDVSKVIYASGTELQIRVLSAYFYGLIEILYAFTHKGEGHRLMDLTPLPPVDVQMLISAAITEALGKFADEQTQMIADLSQRFEQTTSQLAVKQQTLSVTVQEVKDIQQTLQIAGPGESKDEIVNTVLARLQALFEEQQTRRLSTSTNSERSVSERQTQTNTQTNTQTATVEIAKRPKRIDPAEVDAVVYPLLNKDRSLSHRKIAAMPGIPYTETVVYASVKRWREAQPVVESEMPAESEVS